MFMESGVRTPVFSDPLLLPGSVTVTSHHVLLGLLVLCLHCPDDLSQEMAVSDCQGCWVLLPPRRVLPSYYVFSEDRPFCGSRLLWGPDDSDG